MTRPTGRPLTGRGPIPTVLLLILGLALLGACGAEERKEIRVTPTSTADPGLRVIVDNCPGPTMLALSVREEVLWRVETTEAPTPDENDVPDEPSPDVLEAPPPGLREFLVGDVPDGWVETQALETTLADGIRYTISTEPDGQSIDFSLPDLAPGLVFNGVGRAQFNPDLIAQPCSQPADVGAFARDLTVLAALWLTSAALVMVAVILFLFVVTRRFSRIRTIEKRAERQVPVDTQ